MTETVTVHNEPLHLGILSVSVDLMEHLLCLPDGYKIVHADYNQWNRTLDVTLASDALPEVEEERALPRLRLLATVQYYPDTPPEYRKITTEIKASKLR